MRSDVTAPVAVQDSFVAVYWPFFIVIEILVLVDQMWLLDSIFFKISESNSFC